MTGYALLGATWLNLKTVDELQIRMRRYAWGLSVATLAFIVTISILTPFQDPVYFERWFELPGSLYSVAVPVLVTIAAWFLFLGLNDQKELQPFVAALALFVLSFIGIGISFYPMMVPPSLTIWEAAAPDDSLAFALVGTLVLVPLILGYTAYSYWVFRGKVDPSGGYH